jgi:hypothetical protein
MGSPSERARAVLELALARPATLGAGRLICLDGPAGSGKSTLAEAVLVSFADLGTEARAELGPATVLHTDEMLAGWTGLPALAATVRDVVEPLALGRAGRWRRWDWHAGGWAETREVSPGGTLVLEGVGSWSPYLSEWVTVLAWTEAPLDVRRRRALERDVDDFAPYWEQWACDETAVFARDRTRDHADLVIAT